jgi:hypothetical protein
MKTELNVTYKKRRRKYLTENKKKKEAITKLEQVIKGAPSTQ